MKRKKKIISVILMFSLIIWQFSMFAYAKVYSDTDGHWAEQYIHKMTELGIIDKSSSNYFYPSNTYYRRDAAKSCCMLFKEKTYPSSPHPFTDVPTSNAYSKYIKWVYDAGVMSGTSTTTFSPTTGIKRQDMCVVLYNLYFARIGVPIKTQYSKVTFSDDSQISSYAKNAVYTLQRCGVITGDGGVFRPKDILTRAEAATMLYMLWDYGLVLSTIQQQQQKSNWCWAACAKIMGDYVNGGTSRSQSEIAQYINGGANEVATVIDVANGAAYASYFNHFFSSTGTMSYNQIDSYVGDYKPTTLLHGKTENGEWVGHFMVCIGYVKNFSSANNSSLFIYDVWNNTYHWFTYNEYNNGSDDYLKQNYYTHTVYCSD